MGGYIFQQQHFCPLNSHHSSHIWCPVNAPSSWTFEASHTLVKGSCLIASGGAFTYTGKKRKKNWFQGLRLKHFSARNKTMGPGAPPGGLKQNGSTFGHEPRPNLEPLPECEPLLVTLGWCGRDGVSSFYGPVASAA